MRQRPAARSAAAMLLAAGLAAGCAGDDPALAPAAPNAKPIQPVDQALAAAARSGAARAAPRMIAAARRRVSEARSIAFNAARGQGDLDAAQKARIEQLVSAAQLDIRAASAKAKARASGLRLAQLRGGAAGPAGTSGEGAGARRQALQPAPGRNRSRGLPVGDRLPAAGSAADASERPQPSLPGAGQPAPSQRPLPPNAGAPDTRPGGQRTTRPNSVDQ